MRALIKISFCINAKDDADAEYKAKYIASKLSRTYDGCIVESVDEIDFQATSMKEIYSLKNIKK